MPKQDEKNKLLMNLIKLSQTKGNSVGTRPKSFSIGKFLFPNDRLSITFEVANLTQEDKLNLLLFINKHNVSGANGTPTIEEGYTNIEYVDFYEIDELSLDALRDLVALRDKINKDNFFYEYQESQEYAKGSTVKGVFSKYHDEYKLKIGDSVVVTHGSNKGIKGTINSMESDFTGITIKTNTGHILYGFDDADLDKYAKGSTVKGWFGKAKDLGYKGIKGAKSAYAKAKDKTETAIHNKKKGIALDVIDATKDKVVDNKRKMILKGAEEIVDSKYAKGSTLKNPNSESEKFELKVLQALSGYNNGREENGIMEGLGLSNYRFNQYASKQEVAKVEKTLKSLIKNKYIEEGGIGYKITQIGANHLRSFNYGSYGNGGGVAVSSESGLAVGTNADLMMNQNYLQYADGGGVGEKKYAVGIRLFSDETDDMGYGYIHIMAKNSNDAMKQAEKVCKSYNSGKSMPYIYEDSTMDKGDVWDTDYKIQVNTDDDSNPHPQFVNGGEVGVFNYSIGGL